MRIPVPDHNVYSVQTLNLQVCHVPLFCCIHIHFSAEEAHTPMRVLPGEHKEKLPVSSTSRDE